MDAEELGKLYAEKQPGLSEEKLKARFQEVPQFVCVCVCVCVCVYTVVHIYWDAPTTRARYVLVCGMVKIMRDYANYAGLCVVVCGIVLV